MLIAGHSQEAYSVDLSGQLFRAKLLKCNVMGVEQVTIYVFSVEYARRAEPVYEIQLDCTKSLTLSQFQGIDDLLLFSRVKVQCTLPIGQVPL